MSTRAGLLLALSWLGLCACDLRHADQKAFCLSARADPARCASRPDWCIPYGGTSCQAGDARGAYCSSCTLAADQRSCQPSAAQRDQCRFHTPRLGGDGTLVIEHSWQLQGLDTELLGPWAGKPLSRALVEQLDDKQRRVICGIGRGADWSGASYCRLEWDEQQGEATCRYDEAYCRRCEVKVEPFQCLAKNLCSDVICL